MPTHPPVIVDKHIIFSALLRQPSHFSSILLETDRNFFVCESVLVKLFKHKEQIIRSSRLSEDEIIRVYHILIRRLNLFKEDLISPKHRAAAYELCRDIDFSDTPHVALTLELDGELWTGDKSLKEGLQQKGFNRFFAS